MTDEPFGRQPGPVSVIIDAQDAFDRDALVNDLQRWLEGRFDNTNRYRSGESVVIRCYPRAIND